MKSSVLVAFICAASIADTAASEPITINGVLPGASAYELNGVSVLRQTQRTTVRFPENLMIAADRNQSYQPCVSSSIWGCSDVEMEGQMAADSLLGNTITSPPAITDGVGIDYENATALPMPSPNPLLEVGFVANSVNGMYIVNHYNLSVDSVAMMNWMTNYETRELAVTTPNPGVSEGAAGTGASNPVRLAPAISLD